MSVVSIILFQFLLINGVVGTLIDAEASESIFTAIRRGISDEAFEVIVEMMCVVIVFGVTTKLVSRVNKSKKAQCDKQRGCSARSTQQQDNGSTHLSVKRAATLRPNANAFPEPHLQWRGVEAASVKMTGRLAQFIGMNRLDKDCAQLLRSLQSTRAEWVMDQEFVVDVDPAKGTASSKVVSTVMKTTRKSRGFWDAYPTRDDLALRLSAYIRLNDLDNRCAKTLERLKDPKAQRQLMDQEFVLQVDPVKGTASAKVIGRILSLKKADAAVS